MAIDISLARKAAILARVPESGMALKDLADHFGQSWRSMLEEINELFMVEVPSGHYFVNPYDIYIDDDEPGPESFVYLTRYNESDYPAPSLTLNEVVSLLGIVDQALQASDREDSKALLNFRRVLAEATEAAGYSSVLWSPPQRPTTTSVINTLTDAIESQRRARISYWVRSSEGPLESIERVVAPCAISTGSQPALICANDRDELRTYRLDRIFEVAQTDERFSKALARAIIREADEDRPIGSIPVTLQVDPSARWLGEYVAGAVLERDGEDLLVSFTAAKRAWILSLAIRLGEDLRGIGPAELAEWVASQAKELGGQG